MIKKTILSVFSGILILFLGSFGNQSFANYLGANDANQSVAKQATNDLKTKNAVINNSTYIDIQQTEVHEGIKFNIYSFQTSHFSAEFDINYQITNPHTDHNRLNLEVHGQKDDFGNHLLFSDKVNNIKDNHVFISGLLPGDWTFWVTIEADDGTNCISKKLILFDIIENDWKIYNPHAQIVAVYLNKLTIEYSYIVETLISLENIKMSLLDTNDNVIFSGGTHELDPDNDGRFDVVLPQKQYDELKLQFQGFDKNASASYWFPTRNVSLGAILVEMPQVKSIVPSHFATTRTSIIIDYTYYGNIDYQFVLIDVRDENGAILKSGLDTELRGTIEIPNLTPNTTYKNWTIHASCSFYTTASGYFGLPDFITES